MARYRGFVVGNKMIKKIAIVEHDNTGERKWLVGYSPCYNFVKLKSMDDGKILEYGWSIYRRDYTRICWLDN